MNKSTLIGALLLIFGIGIGLILKRGAESPDETTAKQSAKSEQRPGGGPGSSGAPRSAGASGKSDRISGKPWIAPGAQEVSADLAEETVAAFEEAHQAALARVMHAQDRQLAQLTEQLSLTAAQQQQLRARYFDPHRQQITKARIGVGSSAPRSTTPELGKVLGEVLTPEQSSTYRQLREDQRRRENESRTHRELARMSFLDLTPEQREAAYDAIYSSPPRLPIEGVTMNMTAGEEGAPRIVTFKTVRVNSGLTDQVHAIVSDPESGTLVASSVASPQGAGDGANLEEARAKALARDVARFENIFTPEQMQSYRAHLEARTSGGLALPESFPLPALPE